MKLIACQQVIPLAKNVMSIIYLAGPLFSEAKQAWHRATKARIEVETGHTVVWPFELFDQAEIASCGADA